MITQALIRRFMDGVRGQALREGTRYAREARVEGLTGTGESVTTVVRGMTGDFEVALWSEAGRLHHRCECPSWRFPCKHEVAAALVLRQTLLGGGNGGDGTAPVPDPDEARRKALEERLAASRREKLVVRRAEPPHLEVEGPSGFAYRVCLRGGPEGPHSCGCPDFEANRLHTCKHVERVRAWLRAPRSRLPRAHRERASAARVYLHFGEVVEPRLFGTPRGRGAPAVREAFDEDGLPRWPVESEEAALLRRLEGFGGWVEPEALAWLEERVRRRPVLPGNGFEKLVGPLPMSPYSYQWEGAEFLARTGRALLADEMGLGKTVQAILAARALRHALPAVGSVTVVCPASLRGGWRDEIDRWLGEEAVLLEGPPRRRAETISSRPPWLVTHFEQVLRDHGRHEESPPDLLIIDEAQRAKGLWAKTARVLKAIGARHVFALTGTPLENRLEEAYAIAQLLDQRLLPPLWQVDRDHFVREDKGRRVVLYQDLGALRSRLAPAFLRRRKEDVSLQLPERVRSVSFLPMHPAVVDTYEEMMSSVARIASKKYLLPADLDRIQRLLVIARRCCNGPHMLGLDAEDAKVPKLAELEQALSERCLGDGRKAVIFSEWTDMTDRVEKMGRRLGLPTFHLCGSVPVRRRPAMIRDFSATDGPALFVSTDAGGLGLNLQAAEVVVNLDLPWNPARLEQRIARIHRIGSRGTTQELLFVTKDAVEERILSLHDTKRDVLENVWAEEGEDVIAAPGGSGSFRQMVEVLLGAQAPFEPAEGEEEVPESLVAEPVEGPFGKAEPAGGARQPGGDAVSAAAPVPAAAASASEGGRVGIDPEAVAAAVSAVLPVIPQEQRRPLADVFRALAEALDGPPPGAG